MNQIAPDWEEESRHRQVELDNIRTDFLQPAIHPELLGRLGRYDVERMVGAGGFGIVFKAHDSELRRVVALKVLAPHLMSSGAAKKRFAREAQAAAAIVHEHVTPIYDVVSDDRACYLVMQYIAGQSLQDRVDQLGPLPVEDVLRIGSQIASGLDAAHEQGVVHRDVKPANILLEESVDRVLISDFGLARTADDANLTRSGVITGTPHYMSPEQASGLVIDDRSDLFSLGSVLYFMCTGRPPFRAPQVVAVLNRICNHPHRPVSQVNAQIPGPVSDLIDVLLCKEASKRFQSAAAAQLAIQQMLADWQNGKIAADLRLQQATAQRKRQRREWLKQTLSFVSLMLLAGVLCWGAANVFEKQMVAKGGSPLSLAPSDLKEDPVMPVPEPDPPGHEITKAAAAETEGAAAETETAAAETAAASVLVAMNRPGVEAESSTSVSGTGTLDLSVNHQTSETDRQGLDADQKFPSRFPVSSSSRDIEIFRMAIESTLPLSQGEVGGRSLINTLPLRTRPQWQDEWQLMWQELRSLESQMTLEQQQFEYLQSWLIQNDKSYQEQASSLESVHDQQPFGDFSKEDSSDIELNKDN